ncbi:hypothetical protein H257_05521 [Aphanomyces astaci]|uniref:CCHC-type domain-containing protein n=1 Tax=Aphanomyces astaci TaxID=112090 RepID=W4GSW9_APHAT|nr:hypothetical protein H257_05521 [Aphanomyces astaci]ETV81993.1 hypothetical protein H257_05521 [Aphanomyces astaci]|eukprot:XP_009828730.1 hypothetical protein H257_05521 [Aphanomyces astaci]
MTPQQVHDFYWEQFHSIYLCNAFVEESTIWKSLCKMQMKAKNAGKVWSLAVLQRTITEIIQVDLKHHQMLDQHGSADSTTRLQHLAAPAYPSSAPSAPTAFVAHSLTLPSWAHADYRLNPGKSCFYCGQPGHAMDSCDEIVYDYNRNTPRPHVPTNIFKKHGGRKSTSSPAIQDDHAQHHRASRRRDDDDSNDRSRYPPRDSNQPARTSTTDQSRRNQDTNNRSTRANSRRRASADGHASRATLHLGHPTPCILRVNPASPPLVKTTSTIQCYLGLPKSHFQHCSHNRDTFTAPVVYDNHCFLNQAASQLYFLSLSAAVFVRASFSSSSLNEHDTVEEFFDSTAPPVANPADAWRAGLAPTHDHFAFHVGLVDSSLSLKVSYDESSAPTVYKSDSCPQLSQDRIIDSGATVSCTPHKSYFRLSKFRSCSMTLTVGDGGQLPILGYGPVDLTVLSRNITKGPDHHSEPHFLSLPFGLYCPNLKINLLSVRHAVSSGYQVKFDHPEQCLFILDKAYYFRAAVNILGLYSFSATGVPPGSPLPPRVTLTTRAMFDGFKAFLMANPVSPPLPSHPPSLHSTAFTLSAHFPSHHQALNAFPTTLPPSTLLATLVCPTMPFFDDGTNVLATPVPPSSALSLPTTPNSPAIAHGTSNPSTATSVIYERFRLHATSIFKRDIDTIRYAAPSDIGNLQADNAKVFEKLGRLVLAKYHTKTTFSNAYSPS